MKVAKDILNTLPEFCSGVPYQIKKIAIKDAFQAFYTNAKKVKKNGGKFELKFRSRKNPKQSCYIPKSAIKKSGIYPRISGKGLYYAEEIPSLIKDSRLLYDSGKWYIAIPTEEPSKKSENQGQERMVAIDPGIRTFTTFFSDDCFGQIGKHDFGRIVRLCQHLDDLISRISKTSGQKKRSMRKAANRLRWKIKDLISELHHKTAKFFTDNFSVIFLPHFETKKMSCKAGRKLRRKSVRSMLTYSFFKFAEHLKHKCNETGTTLIRVNESYTSKINSFTLDLIPKLGSKEFFNHDGFRINRDVNGARNILCFSLVDTPCVRNSAAKVNNC